MDLLRSLPLGLYLEQPITWLHHLDPRVKFAWLMSFLATPVLANPVWRLLLAAVLVLITLSASIPLRVWRQQMGWLLMLAFFVLVLTAIAPDGMQAEHQPRLPSSELTFPQSPTDGSENKGKTRQLEATASASNQGSDAVNSASTTANQPSKTQKYSYVLIHQGPLKITRKSLDMAVSFSTLLFTLIYSTNLYLLTTAPEEITAGLESLMRPLRRFNVPVTEIVLTLTLSLRFIPLVLEEVQNLVRSVWTRAINWKKLGFRKSLQVWLIVAERLLQNLLLRAEQMANAMQVRGFTSPNEHRVQWYQLRLKNADWMALVSLAVLWGARSLWGGDQTPGL
jgi:energy-coupling factor transport system permease protein